MTFGEKIKQLRIDKNLTQEQASRQMGIAISSLRNYENGRLPDTHQLKIIKNFYNVPYEFLLEDSIINKDTNNINIEKELGLSTHSIQLIKYINEYNQKDVLNFFLEKAHIHGIVYKLTEIKLLEEQWLKNVCFLGRLSHFTTFLEQNLNKKVSSKISNLFDLFNKKMESFYNFVEDNYCNPYYDVDCIDIEQCIQFRKLLQNIQESFFAGNSKDFSLSLLAYSDMSCEISNKMVMYIDFNKYNIQKMINDFLDLIAPDYHSDYLYYKDLKDYYQYIDNECGFSDSILKQCEKTNPNDYIHDNILYVLNSTRKEGVRNGSARNSKK